MNFHKIYNFHPILFGIFPALSLFSTNISEVMVTGLTEVLIVIGVLSAFAAVLWITLKLVIKNTQKSALITSIIVVMIFLYGHIESFLTELIVNQLILILPWFIIFSAMIYLIIRTKKNNATKIWKNETKNAMNFLKVDDYETIFDSSNDNRYLDSKPLHDLIEIIESDSKVSLNKIKPTIVAIPTNYSHHQDHSLSFCE